MSEIKNIYYECKDCNFLCKTKKEMTKHINEVKCNNDEKKLTKINKTNEKKILEDKIKNEFMIISNKGDLKRNKYFKNLQFVELLKKEIPELNLNVKKEAYESFENFLNPKYVETQIFYFLIDKIVLTYCIYLFDKEFNYIEPSYYEKSAIIELIKNKYNFYINCTDEELKTNKRELYSESEIKILKKFEEDAIKNNYF